MSASCLAAREGCIKATQTARSAASRKRSPAHDRPILGALSALQSRRARVAGFMP